jgi:uroporphyrinogen decarboxylase
VIIDMAYLGPFGLPWALRGMEQLMVDMAINPEIVDAIVAKVEEYTLTCLGKVLKKYPGVIDVIGSGDDYGTQNGLFISTEMMRRFFMPSLKRHYDLGRKYGVMGYHHCCGAIFEAIPLFIDAGVQVLNPIQTSAAGMVPERLKKEYGRDLCFHGAIDIQQTLVNGTPADVRAEVRHRIDTLGPEGYILGSSHVLQPDTPPENIIAMYEEARDYGTAVCRR